jgi:hypothetical protein
MLRIAKVTCGDAEKFWNKEFQNLIPDEEPKRNRPGGASVNRGISKRVLAVLIAANNQPMTTAEVAAAVNVDVTVANSSLAYLADRGHAVRVLAGQYVAAPGRLPSATVRHEGTVRHDNDQRPARAAVIVQGGKAPGGAPVPPPASVAAPPTPPASAFDFTVTANGETLGGHYDSPELEPFDLGQNLDNLAASLDADAQTKAERDWEADVDEVIQLWLPERVRLADMGRIQEMRDRMIEFAKWVNRE